MVSVAYAVDSRTVRSFEETALGGGCALQAATDAGSAGVAAVVGVALPATGGVLTSAVGLVCGWVAILMMMIGQWFQGIRYGLRLGMSFRLPLGIGAARNSAQGWVVWVIRVAGGAARWVGAVEVMSLHRGWFIAAITVGASSVIMRRPAVGAAAAAAQLLLYGVLPIKMCNSVHCEAVVKVVVILL